MDLNFEDDKNNVSLHKFERMLKTNKVLFFDSEEFEDIILYYLDHGKINLAKKALKIGLEQHPLSIDLQLIEVEIYLIDDELEKAEQLLANLFELAPNNEEIYIQRANIYSKREQHDKAIEELKIALKITDDKADVYNLIGMEYLFLEDLQNAKENFINCLEADWEDNSALYNVVYCFDFLDENQEAIIFLNDYINKNPYSEVAWHQLGRQYYVLKDYEMSIWALDYATLIDDTFLGAYFEKAKAYEKLKKYHEAINCYKITLELDDATAYAYYRIGKCYTKLQMSEKALYYYIKTTQEDPLLDKAWNAIINTYVAQLNWELAQETAESAIEIFPNNKHFWKKLGLISATITDYDMAMVALRNAIKNGDKDLDTHLLLADIILTLNDLQEAAEVLLKALDLFEDHHEISYRLAGINFLLGENNNGKFHLTNALRKNISQCTILANQFPKVWENSEVQNIITQYLE